MMCMKCDTVHYNEEPCGCDVDGKIVRFFVMLIAYTIVVKWFITKEYKAFKTRKYTTDREDYYSQPRTEKQIIWHTNEPTCTSS